MSRSLTSTRLALAAAVAAVSLAFAAPAMAYPTPAEPSGQPASQHHAVLASGHHSQGTPQVPVTTTAATVQQSPGNSTVDDVALVAGAALLGSAITLGAMTLWRRRDQPLSA